MTDRPTNSPTKMTLEQFEFMLAGIESSYALAMQSARGLAMLASASAADAARQRRANMMVDLAICQLEEMSGVTVETAREERVGAIPFPPRVNRQRTMINFRNSR